MANELPEYAKPPVVEVVCGVTFLPIAGFSTPQTGEFWATIKNRYPNTLEQPLLQPIIEQFPEQPTFRHRFQQPNFPRLWFLNSDKTKLVQLQGDRFLHNWKKTKEDDEYPRFPEVFRFFNDTLGDFNDYLEKNSLGPMQSVQYELTYVNHLPCGEDWSDFSDIVNIFPNFKWENANSRFLPFPESMDWHMQYRLPDNSGRLHARIQKATRVPDSTDVIRFDLTARGFWQDGSNKTQEDWFEQAREWIVRGFTDLTSDEMHRRWGKR